MNILYMMIQFNAFLALGYFWYRVFKWTPEEGMAFSAVSSILMILVCGFLNLMKIVIIMSWGLSLCGALLFVAGNSVLPYKVNGDSVKCRFSFITPGVILLCGVFLYAVIAFDGIHILNWDELHHWGKAAKFMMNEDALPKGEAFDGESVLLATTTVFQYYFGRLSRFFMSTVVESNMYVSNIVLWFTAVILPVSGMGWKNWKRIFIYGATVFMAMNMLFIQPYYNIYCDQPVSVWAGAVLTWVLLCDRKKSSNILLTGALFCISMMKNMMGPLFVVIIIAELVILYIMDLQVITPANIISKIRNDLTWNKIILSVSCLCSAFLLNTVWGRIIRENVLIRSGSLNKGEEDRFILTVSSCVKKVFETVGITNSFPTLTYAVCFILTIILGFAVSGCFAEKKKKHQYETMIVLYAFGFFAYLALMVYAYMTTFSYYDSIQAGSLNRYLSDYIMLGLIPLLYPYICNRNYSSNVLVLCLPLVFFSFGINSSFPSRVLGIGVESSDQGKGYTEMLHDKEMIDKWVDDDKRIYMINQDSNGYYTVMADYLFEHQIDRMGMCYYFTSKDTNTPGLTFINIRLLRQILSDDYGYLWIYKTDDYLNSMAFDVLKIKQPKNGDFYKIEEENGRLSLKYLGNCRDDYEEDIRED